MADPTIQTFCCHHNNSSDMAILIMDEFDTDSYNVVCMISSFIGILGAIYQILPRQETGMPHRWQGFSAARGREIIMWLALADLLASLGVFIRSALWMNFRTIMPLEDDTSSVVFCALTSAWVQYFYMATWIWTLCYAIDMKLLLGERVGKPVLYHLFAWLSPAFLTSFGLSLLYYPDADCHSLTSLSTAVRRILPNYIATYLLLFTVMIANPILYLLSSSDLENVVTGTMAQMTGRERKLFHTVKLKFFMTTLVYYICWLPNVVNGILLWTLWFDLPIQVVITLWYIMAVTNPLQALFNALVYKRWGRRERFRMGWFYKLKRLKSNYFKQHGENGVSEASESSPLLNARYRVTPHTSINGSSSL